MMPQYRSKWLSIGIIAVGVGLSTCKTLQQVAQPEVIFQGVRIGKISLKGATLIAQLQVKNPLPVSLTIPKTDYEFDVEGKSLFEGTRNKKVVIPANNSTIVALPLRFQWSQLWEISQVLREQDSFQYAVKGKIHLQVSESQLIAVPFQRKGKLPIVRPPSFSVEESKFVHLSKEGAEARVIVRMNNPNPFVLQVKHLKGDVMFAGNANAQMGAFQDEYVIPPKGSAPVEIRFRADFSNIGKSIVGILTGSEEPTFAIQGHVITHLPIKELDQKEVVFPFKIGGQVHH